MNVTILGSCTVIQFPDDVERFFHDKNLVDRRNGHLMEMDALPLLFLAKMTNNSSLARRIKDALIANLVESGGELWKCGVWGHDETHCRFSSVALRLMILNQQDFEQSLLVNCLSNHLEHNEQALGGIWFYHDSIETYKQPYYKTWNGNACGNATANNMLILNTHVDTLITLLVAKKFNISLENREDYIQQGLKALDSFFLETEVVKGFKCKVDALARAILLRGLGKRDIFSRGSVYLLKRFYYQKIRYAQKHRQNIRAFSDGFLERDVRLTGPSLEYHVVNIWDMSRLLFWSHYNGMPHTSLSDELVKSSIGGLKYCFESRSYRSYMQRISITKGISNEVLEAIAILVTLGHRHDWMAELYLDWRKFAPASPGIMGVDSTISGDIKVSESQLINNKPESLDCIPFAGNTVFIANNGSQDFMFDENVFEVEWQSTADRKTDYSPNCVNASSISLLRVK